MQGATHARIASDCATCPAADSCPERPEAPAASWMWKRGAVEEARRLTRPDLTLARLWGATTVLCPAAPGR